jgi:hypothetical protein
LRNGAPLLVEQPFGKGRVVAFLSTAAPVWNNWASNNETPSFPVVVRELHAYLSRRPSVGQAHQVGEPLALTVEAAQFQPQVRFLAPGGETAASSVDAVPTGNGLLTAAFPQTETSGFYEVQLTKTTGKPEVRYFAVNVDPAEGDLKAASGSDLAARLMPELKYQFEQAATFQSNLGETSGHNLSEALLYALIILLIGEQLLAWSAGYHPAPGSFDLGRSTRRRGRTPEPAGSAVSTVEGGVA